MRTRADPPATPGSEPLSSLFDLLPIGAYRSLPNGTLLRANPALVRLNGYADEAEMLAAIRDLALEWYVDPRRRDEFRARLERDGHVRAFVSQVYRHKTRERAWVSENAHLLRDGDGRVLCYEGTVEDVTERIETEIALREREQRLREIEQHMPGVVYRLHIAPDGGRRFSFVSENVRSLYGIAPEQVLADGDLMFSFDHPDDHARVYAETVAARRARRPVNTEFRIVLADGTVKWLQLAASTVPSDEPGDTRLGVVLDITARKQAELALRESEARWTLALESVGDGVWDWDIVGRREVLSPRLLEMYGLTPADHDGTPQTLDVRTHPDDRAAMERDRDRHFAGLTPHYANEHRVRHCDGRWIWVLSRGLVIARDGQGRPLRMIGTHTDISERREAEALRAERSRAAAAHKAQGAFLSRVSHELRTPLNAIIGFAQLLDVEHAGTPRQQVWVRNIVDSGRHLLALVNDLLDLSSTQSGQLPVTAQPVDLVPLMREAWTMHAADAEAAGLRLVDRLPAQGRAHADPTRLKQVVSNLYSNAIKYNRPGGRVELALAHDGEWIELQVADTGPGLDAAQLARLFNPFERLGAQHSGVAGTGLGLALSRQLAEAMGGRIDVRSAPGAGSVFAVRLPAAPTDART